MGTDHRVEARTGYERAAYDFLVWLWAAEDDARGKGHSERARELDALSTMVAQQMKNACPQNGPFRAAGTYAEEYERSVRDLRVMVLEASRNAFERDAWAATELDWVDENMHQAFRAMP